jgi:hypothetical protein
VIFKDRGWGRRWVVFIVAPRGAVHFIRVLLHTQRTGQHGTRGGKMGGGGQKAYQVTVAGQAPLSIHCEGTRERIEEKGRGRARGAGGCRVGRSKVDLIL